MRRRFLGVLASLLVVFKLPAAPAPKPKKVIGYVMTGPGSNVAFLSVNNRYYSWIRKEPVNSYPHPQEISAREYVEKAIAFWGKTIKFFEVYAHNELKP